MTELIEKISRFIPALQGWSVRANSPALARPARDWLIVLFLCVTSVVVVSGLGIASYANLSESDKTEGVVRPAPGLDAARLGKALASFRLRAEEHAARLSERPAVVDPSR